MGLIAYHGKQKVKDFYLKRMRDHIKADELIRGRGWDGTSGCAIGCALNAYNHKAYESELGIPEWLAHVEDQLFEGMTNKKSKTWPAVFLSAIKPGADLEKAKGPFLIMVLESALTSFDHKKYPDVKAAIDGSIALWKRNDIGSEDWTRAAAAARAVWGVWGAAAAWAKYDYFADELIKILKECT
jgi:hypothetical protein